MMESEKKLSFDRYGVMVNAMRKRIAGLEEKNRRQDELLFQTLEMLRSLAEKEFSDWKDADDWIFSELDFRKSEIEAIYSGRGAMAYTGSAADDEAGSPVDMDETLDKDEVSLLSGLPIWVEPIGEADWAPQWRICFDSDPYGSALSRTKRASMYFLYLKDYGKTWVAYLYPPMLPVWKDQAEGLVDREICHGSEFHSTGNADLNDTRTAMVLQYLSEKGREASGQEHREQVIPGKEKYEDQEN